MTNEWFRVTPESERLLSEERLLLAATEQLHEALESADVKKKTLAKRLGISASEVGQRLSGRRNLTIRSLASMLHVLGYEANLTIRPVRAPNEAVRDDLLRLRQKQSAEMNRVIYRQKQLQPQIEGAAGRLVAQ